MLRSIFLPNPVDAASDEAPSSTAGWLRSWSAERRRRRLRREAFQTLLKVDDNILDDIAGLRHEQVEQAARLPLSVDALEAIRLMQRQMPKSGNGRVNGCGTKEEE